MRIKVADVLGNEQSKYVGFSWLYLIFGPFYLLCRGKIFTFLLLGLLYFYLLPIPGMDTVVALIVRLPFWTANNVRAIRDSLMFFRQSWHLPFNYIGISFCALLHLFVAFFCEGPLIRSFMRRRMLFPASEEDARKLIWYRGAGFDVKLAPKNGIQSLYGYKSAEQLWIEKNMTEIDRSTSVNPLLDALAPLPKDEITRRRDHLNKLLKNREITVEEYKLLVEHLNRDL